MNVFQSIPNDLFSVLASPNRVLYADALEVLYQVYHDTLKIPESVLYSALRGSLESQLAAASFDGEDIDEEELQDVSGRARFLIRKLCSKGWFEKERGQNFEEYITIPEYSSKILELLHALSDQSPARGYSYVYGTYSLLKVANESGGPYEKMTAVYSAYDNTAELVKLLKTVYHNVKHYFQLQIDLQDVNSVLASHFDGFSQRVMETYIRPLKVKDSVPKYKIPIQSILDGWLGDDTILSAMINAALQDKRGKDFDACRADLLQKIFWVKERYDSLETEFVNEIDQQVRRYTRATTQKIENLTNRDQNVRGNINYLLMGLSRNHRAGEFVERIQTAFQLCEQSYISERSLWVRKRGERHVVTVPVRIEDIPIPDDMGNELLALTKSKYSKTMVRTHMLTLMDGKSELRSEDIRIQDDNAYIMNLLSVINSTDKDSFYSVEILDGTVTKGEYEIPRLIFRRKEGTK